MSDEELASTADDGPRATLEGLISSKKKSGANQLEAKQFSDAWIAYAKAVGINDDTVKILYDGFQFAAGAPLYRYIVDTHARSAYKSLLASAPTKENDQGTALKVLINLLALELSAPTSDDSLRLIAHAIPGLSRNRDGKPFGSLARSIGRIIAKPLAHKAINDAAAIDSGDASLILALLREPVESFATGAKTRSVEAKAATMFLAWLDGQAAQTKTAESSNADEDGGASGQSEDCSRDEAGLSDEAAAAVRHRTDREESTGAAPSSSETGERNPQSSIRHLNSNANALDIDTVVAFLLSRKKDYESIQKDNASLREAEREAMAKASHAKANLRSAQEELGMLRAQLSALNEKYARLQTEVQALKSTNESLAGELAATEKMLKTIDRRDARQADESTKRLASELKVEYRDFLDALDLTMDADLGENMREQLKNVFEILKSSGINL